MGGGVQNRTQGGIPGWTWTSVGLIVRVCVCAHACVCTCADVRPWVLGDPDGCLFPAFLAPSHHQEVTSQNFFCSECSAHTPPTPHLPPLGPLSGWIAPALPLNQTRLSRALPASAPLRPLGLLLTVPSSQGHPPAHQSCPSPPAVTPPSRPALPPKTPSLPLCLASRNLVLLSAPPSLVLGPLSQGHPCPLLQPSDPHLASLCPSVLCPLSLPCPLVLSPALSPLSSIPLLLSSVPPSCSLIPSVQPSNLCLQL